MVNLSLVTEPISFGRNNTQIRKERERGGGKKKMKIYSWRPEKICWKQIWQEEAYEASIYHQVQQACITSWQENLKLSEHYG